MVIPSKSEMNVRRTMHLLLDEHISPRLILQLSKRHVFAQCVPHIGLSGRTDPEIWRYAYRHDQVVVTANARDCLTLAVGSEVHAGLIVLRAQGLTADQQWRWLEPVIDHVMAESIDLLNHVVEISGVGQFTIRPIPSP